MKKKNIFLFLIVTIMFSIVLTILTIIQPAHTYGYLLGMVAFFGTITIICVVISIGIYLTVRNIKRNKEHQTQTEN